MKLDIYVNYAGKCEEAFRFYEQHLGGKITMMMTHEQQPNQANVPVNRKKTILHARIEIGKTVLMGGQIFMKMEETFFASRFAMLRDKFGTSWMLLHERNPSLIPV